MKDQRSIFWSIPTLGLYFYAATVLTELKYLEYFGIPSSFVQASLKDNIVYFYNLFLGFNGAVTVSHWTMRFVMGIVTGIIIALYYQGSTSRKILKSIGAFILLLILLFWFPRFGTIIAQNQPDFYVASASCPPLSPSPTHITPIINNGQAVFVPVDSNNKMAGGFIVKNLAEIPCTIEHKTVGKITR